MYYIVRQLKKHQSDIMISIILVSPVLSTNNFEEFVEILLLLLLLFYFVVLLLLLFYFVLCYYYYYYYFIFFCTFIKRSPEVTKSYNDLYHFGLPHPHDQSNCRIF